MTRRTQRTLSGDAAAPSLDVDFVRTQFPAFAEPSLADRSFVENAGGSYACRQVIDRLGEYYRRLKVQPYHRHPASIEAGLWMDAAYARLAEYLNVSADEVQLGPSTSQNTYVLAQAFRAMLRPGDEIIVTNQDHEANSGVWRRLAGDGATVREWKVDPASGLLDLAGLDALIGERTRLLCFSQCSNVVAHLNPVAAITARARRAGAYSVVDGVAAAPHGLPDVDALGADVYLCSLYKTYGPHQGLMVVRRPLLEQLPNQAHYFHDALPHRRLVPAGPDHAQIAAARGIAEYFDLIDAHHGGGDPGQRPARIRSLLHTAEQRLLAPLLEFLTRRTDLRVLGPTDPAQRAGTIACVPTRIAPAEVVARLGQHGVMAGAGHFYAVRLLEAMGIDPGRGVLRLSLVHYNSPADVERTMRALDQLLAQTD